MGDTITNIEVCPSSCNDCDALQEEHGERSSLSQSGNCCGGPQDDSCSSAQTWRVSPSQRTEDGHECGPHKGGQKQHTSPVQPKVSKSQTPGGHREMDPHTLPLIGAVDIGWAKLLGTGKAGFAEHQALCVEVDAQEMR